MHSSPPRLALIDMGTNTFHLLIVEMPLAPGEKPVELMRTKAGVRLGEGGISQGEIAPAAYSRALHTMLGFKEEIDLHEVTDVRATATSAMRVSRNGPDLVREIAEKTGIEVEVIAGDREAQLIWKGVRQAVRLDEQPQLIMDVGGGSTEFIIANDSTIFWKQSFEIGAQRLLDKFFSPCDGIMPAASVSAERDFLAERLAPLSAAVAQYQPVGLVGASGSFDTLGDLQAGRVHTEAEQPVVRELSLPKLKESFNHLLSLNHEQRVALPGMFPMRADMLVVASILIDYVLTTYNLTRIQASAFALKEGLLAEMVSKYQA